MKAGVCRSLLPRGPRVAGKTRTGPETIRNSQIESDTPWFLAQAGPPVMPSFIQVDDDPLHMTCQTPRRAGLPAKPVDAARELAPAPAYDAICEPNGRYGERVDDPARLPGVCDVSDGRRCST